jgi:hypothetical protein
MSRSGINMAVTKDGGTYNKLRRPDDFLAATTTRPSPVEELDSPSVSTGDLNKRKLEQAEISDSEYEDEPEAKRQKDGQVFKASLTSQKPLATDPRRIKRPVRDCGMQSMFPGMDDEDSSDEGTKEALAYLRSVR